jgi:hypothetical protein
MPARAAPLFPRHRQGGTEAPFHDVVEAIVDHHKDSNEHKLSVLPGFRNIQLVGSACSLVAHSMVVRTNSSVPPACAPPASWPLPTVAPVMHAELLCERGLA